MAETGLSRNSAFDRLFQDQVPDPAWSFAHLTQKDTNYLTHGYHRYPAKFIPQLAAALIEAYSRAGEWVLDPFMGSGTTLVEAKRLGRPSVGIDINPVAHLIARAKVRAIDPLVLQKAIQALQNRLLSIRGPSLFDNMDELFASGVPSGWPSRLRYWFREDILLALEAIRQAIETLSEEVRPFFWCALSHILKAVSYWHDKSVKPIRKLSKAIPNPHEVFFRQVRRMAQGNAQFWTVLQQTGSIETYAQPYLADARSLPLADESIDLIVTSPPYVTSYEYADLHQLSALWFAWATDLREFRKSFIGRSQVETPSIGSVHSPLAESIINALSENDPRKAREVHQYFAEMYTCFREWRRVLRSGGRACIVIGNTHLSGVEVQNAQVFAEQLSSLGFELEKVTLREIPNKVLPQTRDKKTGKFAKSEKADYLAYPVEYVVVFRRVRD